MNMNNWLTTHLPPLVYVVIERPLSQSEVELSAVKVEGKKNLKKNLAHLCRVIEYFSHLQLWWLVESIRAE